MPTCYLCDHGHAVKLSTIEKTGAPTDVHGLCNGCASKFLAACANVRLVISRFRAVSDVGSYAGSPINYVNSAVLGIDVVEDV